MRLTLSCKSDAFLSQEFVCLIELFCRLVFFSNYVLQGNTYLARKLHDFFTIFLDASSMCGTSCNVMAKESGLYHAPRSLEALVYSILRLSHTFIAVD